MSREVSVSSSITSVREEGENIGLHRFALFTACCTAFLIFVGGLVTSTESGLSVPDWPTTYGWNMFTFPYSKWVGGIFYEHGHRLVASFVGFFTIVLAVWTWFKEERRWVRWLSLAAVGTVVAQGILGGITVLFFLPTSISTLHACLAQTFFCLMVSLALFTSPGWKRGLPALTLHREAVPLPFLCAMTTAAVYLQLIIGALMRHTDSGLAIPDFPLAFGRIIPPFTSEKIVIHFVHRLGAVIVTALVVWTFARIARHYAGHRLLFRPALVMLFLLSIQLTLGALTVWTSKAVTPTTAHVAIGALVLGTSLLVTLRAFGMSKPQIPRISRINWRNLRNLRLYADLLALTKPRITAMVLVTTLVGFYMGSRESLDLQLLFHSILGTALVASGASALNQYFERDLDARMQRTRNRPLPGGRLSPNQALLFSSILSVLGVAYLVIFVNLLTGVLGLVTLAAYIFVYTPLKTRTTLCTLIGAFPGAAPPVMGWTAARGDFDGIALSLFAILFLWQMPHFFAIAWIFTEDYVRGGFVTHVRGESTSRQIIFFCCALIPISVLPTIFGLTGMVYLLGSILLGFVYLGYGFAVALFRSNAHAQRLLMVSVLYLPALLVLMMLDKV